MREIGSLVGGGKMGGASGSIAACAGALQTAKA